MCVLTGSTQACLLNYTSAIPATPTVPARIVGVDTIHGGTVVAWFMGGCYGVEGGANRTFFLPVNEYDDVKDALEGPNHVHFCGVPDAGSDMINSVAWKEKT